MDSGVYKILLGNGHVYYGSARNLASRKKQHFNQLKRRGHGNPRVQSCWNKYGIFEFVVLERCSDFIVAEQAYLDMFFADPECVNVLSTAGNTTGYKHTPSTIKKMSEKAKLRAPMSAETRRKMSESKKGIPKSPEHRRKLAESNRGKHQLSPAHRKAVSDANRRRVFTPEMRAKLSAAMIKRNAKYRLVA
jgi:group I intron endonuclease